MSDLQFFLLTKVFTQTFNIVDLEKFLEKKSKTTHLDRNSHIEGDLDLMQKHERKRKMKKVKNQDSIGKTYIFLSTLPSNPLTVLATWLHVGTTQQVQEK
jgi:hypothetical protein